MKKAAKKVFTLCLVFLLAAAVLCACSGTEAEPEETVSWQDLYDQGAAMFSEGNYEEAIAAFTEAIGLDPEQVPGYIGRGDSYVRKITVTPAEVEENLAKAKADYEAALAIDGSSSEAYLGKADVLIRLEEFEEAYNTLLAAQDLAADQDSIREKVQEFESGSYVDSSDQLRRKDSFDANTGELLGYTVYEYDFLGKRSGWRNYGDPAIDDGIQISLQESCRVTYDDNGLPIRNDYYYADGSSKEYQTMEYDDRGLETRRNSYTNEGTLRGYFLTYYDDAGRETGYDTYDANGALQSYWRYDYDEAGNLVQENAYSPDGELLIVRKPSGN